MLRQIFRLLNTKGAQISEFALTAFSNLTGPSRIATVYVANALGLNLTHGFTKKTQMNYPLRCEFCMG